MGLLNRLLAFGLVLTLLLTGGAMAVARGNTEIGSLIVICHGTGYATVEIGADGSPVERTVICPDCALTLLPDVPAPALAPRRAGLGLVLVGAEALPDLPQAAPRSRLARGPPLNA